MLLGVWAYAQKPDNDSNDVVARHKDSWCPSKLENIHIKVELWGFRSSTVGQQASKKKSKDLSLTEL